MNGEDDASLNGETGKTERNRTMDRLVLPAKTGNVYKTFSVRIKDSTLEQIDDVAKRTGTSRSALVQLMIDYALVHIDISSAGEGTK